MTNAQWTLIGLRYGMENYTDFELMISRSINKLHDARRQAEIDSRSEAPTTEAPTIDSTTEAPTIEGIVRDDSDNPVDDPSFQDRSVLDVRMPTDRCPMCGLGPQAPLSQGLVLIDEDTKLNPKMLKHYSCRDCGWWWSNEGGAK